MGCKQGLNAIQAASGDRLVMDTIYLDGHSQAYLLIAFIFTVSSTSSPGRSRLMAPTSVSRGPSVPLLMLIYLPPRVLLLLGPIMVIFSSVFLTLGDCVFTLSVLHMVVHGLDASASEG